MANFLIFQRLSKSKILYDVNDSIIEYIAALFLSKIIRMNRLRHFCPKAALHILAYLELGHLVNINLFNFILVFNFISFPSLFFYFFYFPVFLTDSLSDIILDYSQSIVSIICC